MALYADPQQHAANPPETWQARRAAPRIWHLVDRSGAVLASTETKRAAEVLRESGFYFRLWHEESRWYAGETIPGWKPYAETVR